MKRYLIAPLFLFVFLVNPAFIAGCGTIEDDFTYGESEMIDLLNTVSERTWSYSDDSIEYEVEFELAQGDTLRVTRSNHGVVSPTWACTERNFVRDAAACTDLSQMAVEGTVTVTDTEGTIVLDAAPVQGVMSVVGFQLSNANLSLTTEDLDLRLASEDGERFTLVHARW